MEGPSQVEGERGALSLLRDRFKSHQWVEDVALRHNLRAERVGIVTERQGIVPMLLERQAINELLENWRNHGGVEVGGWLVGEEGAANNHPYLHIKHVIADYGIGRGGDFQFRDIDVALNYARERQKAGEKLVVVGTAHTHPQGWSGRITGYGRDLTVFSSYEPEIVNSELWSNYRSHIVLTPADNQALDVWQPKRSNEPWEKRLIRNGYFILEPKATTQGRVRVIG